VAFGRKGSGVPQDAEDVQTGVRREELTDGRFVPQLKDPLDDEGFMPFEIQFGEVRVPEKPLESLGPHREYYTMPGRLRGDSPEAGMVPAEATVFSHFPKDDFRPPGLRLRIRDR